MNKKSYHIYTPIILALAILLSFLVTKPLYIEYQDMKTRESSLIQQKDQKQQKLNELIDFQRQFATNSGTTAIVEKVKKINKKWNNAAIMSAVMLNDYTKWTEYVNPQVTINTIDIDPGKRLPNWLMFGNVRISLWAESIDNLIDYLTYLTSASDFVFTLDSISLPITAPWQKDTSGVTLSVDLGVYYYE